MGLLVAVMPARGQEAKQEPKQEPSPADITPPWGTFPQPGAGIELAGELVVVDHVNRRFGLRLDGDFNKYRYFNDAKLKATVLEHCAAVAGGGAGHGVIRTVGAGAGAGEEAG